MMTEKQIAKYEAKGFNRWTLNEMDRLYINVKEIGLEVEYYKTGNVSSAKWCGEHISNADARRFLSSKVFVDVKTGQLHVQDKTNSDWHHWGQPTIEDKALELYRAIESEIAEGKSKRTEIEEKRDELCKTVEEFVADRIAASEGMPEDKRKQGIALLETARDKAIAYIRNMDEMFVLTQVNDGRRLLQSYGLR